MVQDLRSTVQSSMGWGLRKANTHDNIITFRCAPKHLLKLDYFSTKFMFAWGKVFELGIDLS